MSMERQSQTYPSNPVVNYTYDAAGRPLSAAAGATSYASSIDYAAHRAVSARGVRKPRNRSTSSTTFDNQAPGIWSLPACPKGLS